MKTSHAASAKMEEEPSASKIHKHSNMASTLICVSFFNCSAFYGGACYIYFESENNNIIITNCTFTSNTAILKSSSGSSKTESFGRSAVLLTAKNSNVEKCKFLKNKGSSAAFKIYNKFDNKKSSIISLMSKKTRQISNTISVSDCEFEVENGSESSTYYVDDRDGSDAEVKECLFKRKVDKGKNYIEEKLLTKDAPKLRINSCEFEQMIDSVMNNNTIIENGRIYNEDMVKNIFFVWQ